MESPKSPTSLLNFMEERARELYDFVAAYIESEGITKEGGITIAGWSMGSLWINALLTFGPTFPIGNFPIADYIRALTAYGLCFPCEKEYSHTPPYLIILRCSWFNPRIPSSTKRIQSTHTSFAFS